MSAMTFFVAPGQRYRQHDGWVSEQEVTVVRLDHDSVGVPRIIFLGPRGREIAAYADQVEAAVTAGDLVLVDGSFSRVGLEPVTKLAS